MKRLYQAARELKGITGKSQLARALGTSPQTVKNWESRGVSKQGIIDAQNMLGISATWVQTGEGSMNFHSLISEQDEFTPAYTSALPWVSNVPQSKYVFTKILTEEEIKEKPQTVMLQDGEGFYLPFSESVLEQKGIKQENVLCGALSGDSMSRLMPDGAIFAADKGSTTIKDGQIYAFLHDGLFRIKYLYRMPGNQVRMVSENSAYPEETASLESIDIIGRVFWWSVLV